MILARRLILVAFVVAVLVLGWMLASRNGAQVSVDTVAYRFEAVRLWEVLVCAFTLGALLAGALMSFSLARARLLARRYRKEIRGLEKEVHQLRNLPVAPTAGGLPADLPSSTGRS